MEFIQHSWNMDIISHLFLGIGLLIAGIQDLRWRKISLWLLLVFAGIGLCARALNMETNLSWLSILGGMAIGAAILVLSCSRDFFIGSGDGVVIMMCGVYLGYQDTLKMCMTAFFLVAIVGIGILAKEAIKTGYFQKKLTMPFCPFLFFTYLLWVGGKYL